MFVHQFGDYEQLKAAGAPEEEVAEAAVFEAEVLAYRFDDYSDRGTQEAVFARATALGQEALTFYRSRAGSEAENMRFRIYSLLGNLGVAPAESYLLAAQNSEGREKAKCLWCAAAARASQGVDDTVVELLEQTAAILLELNLPAAGCVRFKARIFRQLLDEYAASGKMLEPEMNRWLTRILTEYTAWMWDADKAQKIDTVEAR